MKNENDKTGLPVSPSVTPEGPQGTGPRELLRASVAFDLIADTLADMPKTHLDWTIRFCRDEALAFRQMGGFPRAIEVSKGERLTEYFALVDKHVKMRDAAPAMYRALVDVVKMFKAFPMLQSMNGAKVAAIEAVLAKARGEAAPAIQSPTPQQGPKKGTQGGQ